ncbi:MAG: DUF3859 domain-containing protein [Phycisphaerae bacterium]
MAKKKPDVRIRSYGIYTPFDRKSDELPKILEFTHRVPARVGIEFGMIVNIRKARGEKMIYRIEHPPFLNEEGDVTPPFVGETYVPAPDYDFFLGDTIWEPAEDKVGKWTVSLEIDGDEIASHSFDVIPEDEAE